MNQRQTILIIDDSPDIHRLIEARGRSLEVDFASAFDITSGLELARLNNPDLILLDVDLGEGASGFDLCTQLKADPATQDISVIFLTAQEHSESKVLAFEVGAVDYVVKPFDYGELLARMRSALRTRTLLLMLAEHANMDGLTGLHNRRFFDERLVQEIEVARRYQCPLALLLLDIDHFKSINDSFGHPRGDQVIQRMAKLLMASCRTSDIPCRLGGDEFALILPQTRLPLAEALAQRLCGALHTDETVIRLDPTGVTCSIGIAGTDARRPLTAEELITTADQALYKAKHNGRDGFASLNPAAAAA
ncbi:MAG: diguanylate cyclase [Phycisphaeraceae bacterium]